MLRELASRPDDLALVHAMETEHAAIDPLLNAIHAAITHRGSGAERLGDLTDGLVTALTGHLKHEEKEALPLINATLTQQQWQHFSEVHRNRIGGDVPRYFPWLLENASTENTAAVLGLLPENIRNTYRDDWLPAYSRLDLWSARTGSAST